MKVRDCLATIAVLLAATACGGGGGPAGGDPAIDPGSDVAREADAVATTDAGPEAAQETADDTAADPVADPSGDPASDAAVDASDTGETGGTIASVAVELGLTQYSGTIHPVVASSDSGSTTYTFDTTEGPMCLRGAPFKVGVRDAGSKDLLIFLQGGGVCSKAFCLAVDAAGDGVPDGEILNPAQARNPAAGWNVVYLSYCDGSFFLGDATWDDNVNGNGKRWHRGLANLTAGIEVAAQRFPDPERILLAGSSAGAYGLLLAWPLLRHYYPDTPLVVMADSGIGIARDGDDSYVKGLLDEFNISRFIPKDCPECLDNGHMTGMIAYWLQRDPGVRFGTYSSWYDGVLAGVFLQVPPEQFAKGVEEQTDRIAAAYPDRFRRFITGGQTHTTLLGDVTGIIGTDINAVELPAALSPTYLLDIQIGSLTTMQSGNVMLSDWLKALIAGDLATWVDVKEPQGTPPTSETRAE